MMKRLKDMSQPMHRKRISPLLDTTKEYAATATVHGVGYVHNRDIPAPDRILWLILVCFFLCMSTLLSYNLYNDWQDNRVITTLQRTTKPVSELQFPAVTICREGLDMEAVKKALEFDFLAWRENKKRKKRSTEDDLSEFLQAQFGFDTEAEYNMMDILQSMASPDVEATAGMNAARETWIACREEEIQEKVRKKRAKPASVTFKQDATAGGVAIGIGVLTASLQSSSGKVKLEGGSCPKNSLLFTSASSPISK